MSEAPPEDPEWRAAVEELGRLRAEAPRLYIRPALIVTPLVLPPVGTLLVAVLLDAQQTALTAFLACCVLLPVAAILNRILMRPVRESRARQKALWDRIDAMIAAAAR